MDTFYAPLFIAVLLFFSKCSCTTNQKFLGGADVVNHEEQRQKIFGGVQEEDQLRKTGDVHSKFRRGAAPWMPPPWWLNQTKSGSQRQEHEKILGEVHVADVEQRQNFLGGAHDSDAYSRDVRGAAPWMPPRTNWTKADIKDQQKFLGGADGSDIVAKFGGQEVQRKFLGGAESEKVIKLEDDQQAILGEAQGNNVN